VFARALPAPARVLTRAARMYVDGTTLDRALRTAARFREANPRFAAWVALWIQVHFAMRSVLRGGQRLDDVLYPEWKDQPVREPVFIFASARSGTTLMHRLLSEDEERFTTFKLYQTVVPAVSLYRGVQGLGRLDESLLGATFRKALERVEAKIFPDFRAIHPMGLTQAEEDEALWVYALLSPALFMLFPFVDELDRIRSLDHLSAEERERLMTWYRSCLQRHLYADGGGRTLLTKNVFAAARLDAILAEFPDARIVNLVRHPYEAIPSALSMLTIGWSALFPGLDKTSPRFAAFADLVIDFYRRYAELADRMPAERIVTVRYPDLVADSRKIVDSVYDHFGWDQSPAVDARLSAACIRTRGFKSGHRYALEDFGLTKDGVYERLSDLFERFDFER
jgi:hypothetical protein